MLVLLSGVFLPVGACAVDLAYYAVDLLTTFLPSILAAAASSSSA